MEPFTQIVEHSIAFWYLASHASQRESFWDTAAGRFVLAIMPAIITAFLTATVTVGGIYISMRESMTTLQQNMVQMQQQHALFYAQQEQQDRRISEAEKGVAKIQGALEINPRGRQ